MVLSFLAQEGKKVKDDLEWSPDLLSGFQNFDDSIQMVNTSGQGVPAHVDTKWTNKGVEWAKM